MDNKMKKQTDRLAWVVIGFLFGVFFVGAFFAVPLYSRVKKLEDLKQIIVYRNKPLSELDFKIVDHDARIPSNEHETYWCDDYLIHVFRSNDLFYIKIYEEWEGN